MPIRQPITRSGAEFASSGMPASRVIDTRRFAKGFAIPEGVPIYGLILGADFYKEFVDNGLESTVTRDFDISPRGRLSINGRLKTRLPDIYSPGTLELENAPGGSEGQFRSIVTFEGPFSQYESIQYHTHSDTLENLYAVLVHTAMGAVLPVETLEEVKYDKPFVVIVQPNQTKDNQIIFDNVIPLVLERDGRGEIRSTTIHVAARKGEKYWEKYTTECRRVVAEATGVFLILY